MSKYIVKDQTGMIVGVSEHFVEHENKIQLHTASSEETFDTIQQAAEMTGWTFEKTDDEYGLYSDLKGQFQTAREGGVVETSLPQTGQAGNLGVTTGSWPEMPETDAKEAA